MSNCHKLSKALYCNDEFTHVSDKYHPAVGNQIEERLNLPMLFEQATHIVTVRFILNRTLKISLELTVHEENAVIRGCNDSISR